MCGSNVLIVYDDTLNAHILKVIVFLHMLETLVDFKRSTPVKLRLSNMSIPDLSDLGLQGVKAAPWDDINFRFQFCNGVVYTPDHDFIFFRVFRFLKIF